LASSKIGIAALQAETGSIARMVSGDIKNMPTNCLTKFCG
jgi:hypothetical protein